MFCLCCHRQKFAARAICSALRFALSLLSKISQGRSWGPFFLHSSEHESQHAHGCLQHTAAQTLAAGIHNYGIAICALSVVLDSHRFKMLRAVRVFDAEAIGSFQLW